MTITTLRPNATAKNVNVSTSGGASAFSVLDDTGPNDATFAQGNTHKGYLWLDLGTSTIGATNRVKQARIRARVQHEGTDVGHTEYVNARFRDSLNGARGPIHELKDGNAAAVEELSMGYDQASPSGGTWSQSVVDRLQVELFWRISVNGQFLKVTELYVDLDVNAQPTVSAVTVTGSTTTTRPTWSFTFADTDGDTQAAYQVKVFSSDQYGAAGFSADTSESTWDSGVVPSDAILGSTDADLVNGVTYRWYVRAAQDWPTAQGLGALWWSDWANSSATAITLSPPPTPTLTAVMQPTVPGYRMKLTATAAVNLITANQASLETDTTGWTALSNCSISRSTSYFVDGAASLQMSSTASGTMTAEMSLRPQVRAGAQMTAVGTVRAAVSSRTVRIGIRFYDVAGALIGSTNFGTGVADATGTDTTPTVTVSAPANAHTAAIVPEVQSTGGAAEIHRWDKMDLHYGAGVGWTPGGFKDTASVVFERRLPVSATIARGPARNWVHPQMRSAGAYLRNTDGFSTRQAADSVRAMVLDRAYPESPDDVSAGMIEWTVRTTASSFLDVCHPGSGTFDPRSPYLLPAPAGAALTLSFWAHATASFAVQVFVRWLDNTGATLSSVTASPVTLTTTEQKLTAAGTAPAGAVWARVEVENDTPTNNVRAYFYGFRWRRTAEPDEPWPGQTFVWETETVRNVGGASIVDGANDLLVYDHEPPAGRPVVYWARTVATNSSGESIASANSVPVALYVDPPAQGLLKDPYEPENAVVCQPLTDHDVTQDEDATEFHPLGADGDPVIWRDWLGGENGRIAVFTGSELERYRLDQIHRSARPLLIHWAEGGNTYVRITRRAKAPMLVSRGYWRAEFDYVQCGRP